MSFGDRLKQARLSMGLKQGELAAMLGVTNSAIANYETEVSSPKEEVLLKIFDVLHVTPNFLFQDSFASNDIELNFQESSLIKDYRSLTSAGQDYIRQTMDMAKKTYNKAEGDKTTGDDDEEYIYGRAIAYGGATTTTKISKKDDRELVELINKIVKEQAKEHGELKDED